jgi:hypothetical protein
MEIWDAMYVMRIYVDEIGGGATTEELSVAFGGAQ